MRRLLTLVTRVDWTLILIPFLLSGVGLTMVYTLGLAQNRLELFWSQLTYAAVAAVVFLLAALMDYRLLRQLSGVLYGVGLGLLGLVLVIGHTSFGATRWIDLGPFQLQPVEVMKALVLLAVAGVLAEHGGRVSWRHYLGTLTLTALPIGLVVAQPDLGSSIVLATLAAGLLIASRLSRRQLVASALLLGIILTVGWFTLRDYQRQRFEVFVHSAADPQGASYNVRQSIIAVGSGGLRGQGIGRGSQSQLNFLPVAHTDFMFATVAEATGFVGALTIIVFYVLLVVHCWRLAVTLTDPFARLVAIGVGTLLFVQVTVNVGMNLGLLPVTGIPLPFVSHGGSSLIVAAFLMGTLEGMYLRREKLQFHE